MVWTLVLLSLRNEHLKKNTQTQLKPCEILLFGARHCGFMLTSVVNCTDEGHTTIGYAKPDAGLQGNRSQNYLS